MRYWLKMANRETSNSTETEHPQDLNPMENIHQGVNKE